MADQQPAKRQRVEQPQGTPQGQCYTLQWQQASMYNTNEGADSGPRLHTGWQQHFKEQTVDLAVGSARQGQVWEQQQHNPAICNVLLMPSMEAARSSADEQRGVRLSGAVLAERADWFLALAGHLDDLPSGTRRHDGCLVIVTPIDVPEGVLRALVAAMHNGKLVVNADNIVQIIELADAMQAEAVLNGAVRALTQQARDPKAPPVLLEFAFELLLRLPGLAASANALITGLVQQVLGPYGSLTTGWRLPKNVLVPAADVCAAAIRQAGRFKSHTRLLLAAALHDRPDILQHVDWQYVAPQEARAVVRILQSKKQPVSSCAAWLARAASDESGWAAGNAQYDVVEYCCGAPPRAAEGLICFGGQWCLRFDNGINLHQCTGSNADLITWSDGLAVSCLEASAAGMGWLSDFMTDYADPFRAGWGPAKASISHWKPYAIAASNGKRKLTIGIEISRKSLT